MKKILSILVTVIMLFSLAACGQTSATESGLNNTAVKESSQTDSTKNNESQDASSPSVEASKGETEQAADGKTLIVYFSWSASGNTKKMADYIKEQTNGDVFEIVPQNPYPTDYDECGDVALVERDNNQRPAISDLLDSIEEYDTVFIGYPIWWHTAPMIIGTFLESYDLSGIDVYPFTQSASMDVEQFNNSMEFVRESAKGATVHDGLFVKASDIDGIQSYLTENRFAE